MEKLLHAYIITGAARPQLEREAQRMSALALCTAPKDGQPCGQCRDCRKVLSGIHPDVIRLEREKNRDGKLRQELVIEQLRDLAVQSAVLPNEGARKVFCFPEADKMNLPAQNAFLKLLEEPPEYVLFLLCAEKPAALLPTVRSRCAVLRLEGEDADPLPDKAVQRAGDYLAALGDGAGRLRCCAAWEKLDTQELRDTVEALRRSAPNFLTGTALLSLEAELNTLTDYLRANVGGKHILGMLATYEMRNDL